MKRLTLFITLLTVVLSAMAQNYMNYVYDNRNSTSRIAIVLYEKDARGFYKKSVNIPVESTELYQKGYAYDKKSHQLYIKGNFANYVVTVNDSEAKLLKRNKHMTQGKEDELHKVIEQANHELEEKFTALNLVRQKEIEDSIARAKADSIKEAREDSLNKVRQAQEDEDYRKTHDWRWVPVHNYSLTCTLCDKTIRDKNSLFCMGVRNDTLYHVSVEELALGVKYSEVHPLPVSEYLKRDYLYNYHLNMFGDSLQYVNSQLMDKPATFNYVLLSEAFDEVNKIAPYGYFEDWEWDNEYGTVSFNFRYTNTNKATIKYIDVYWVITNDVNDVRKTGHFQGTGPLEEWQTASWDWDYSSYYVAGDATNMNITKVIITYTNGQKKVLTKSMLRFN